MNHEEISVENAPELYLDLMKKCLVNWIYSDYEFTDPSLGGHLRKIINTLLFRTGNRLVTQYSFDPKKRKTGEDRPPYAHTMIGLKRLDNIQFCVEDVLRRNVRGDLIETGIWRGGACIFMRAILKAYNITDRIVWAADSFEGVPKPRLEIDKKNLFASRYYKQQDLKISINQVKSNFERYELLDDQVRFLKGWFSETLPAAPIKRLGIIRLDGDLYESTMDATTYLYPKLSIGGYLIVDDYNCVQSCKQAIQDYRSAHNIMDEIHEVDWTAVCWQRTQ